MKNCGCKKSSCSICNNLYQLAIIEGRARDMTLTEYLDSVEGDKGDNGLNNYELWLLDGHEGTLSDYLNWLREEAQPIPGQGVINVNVFRRGLGAVVPEKPTGGSYEDPSPTDTEWKDIPPFGDGLLYISEATFTSDGNPPQRDWSEPMLLASSDSLRIKYSNVEVNPGTPDSNPLAWQDDPDAGTYWLGLQKAVNGIWGSWQIIKIKGDTGEKGDPGNSPEFRFAMNGSFTVPPTLDVSERYPVGWDTKAPTVTPGQYVWVTQTIIDTKTNTLVYNWSIPNRYSGKDGEDGAAGQSSYKLDLSNENITVPADYEGNVVSSIPNSKATVYFGITEDTGWNFGGSFVGCTGNVNLNTGVIIISTLSADSATVTVTAQKNNITLTAVLTLSKSKAGAPGEDAIIYYVNPSESVIKVSKTGSVNPTTISCKKMKVIGNQSPIETTDHTLVYKLNGGVEQNYTGSINISNTDTSIQFILKNGSVILDSETVPVVKDGLDGTGGTDALRIDLTNESSSVPATYEGVVQGIIPGTTAIIYKGSEIDAGWTFTGIANGCTADVSTTGIVTVSAMSADSATVTITGTKAGNPNLTAVYTLAKVRAGAPGEDAVVYYIIPSVNSIKKDKNGNLIPTSITCNKYKRVGSNDGTITTDHTLFFSKNGGIDQNYTGAITISPTDTSITFKLMQGVVILDIETVPVISDGTDGNNGSNGTGIEAKYFVTNVGQSAPNINTEVGWTETPPVLTNTQTLWEKLRTISGDGTVGPWHGPYKKTGDDGTTMQGASMAYRGDWSNLKQYSGNQYVVDIVKYLNNGRGYIARTDVPGGLIPVGTLPTDTNYWNEFTVDADAVFTDFLFAYSGYIQKLTVGILQTATEGERVTIGYMPKPEDSPYDPTSDASKFTSHGMRYYYPSDPVTGESRIAMYDGYVKDFKFNTSSGEKTVTGMARIVFKNEVNSPVFYVVDSVTVDGGFQYVGVTPARWDAVYIQRLPSQFQSLLKTAVTSDFEDMLDTDYPSNNFKSIVNGKINYESIAGQLWLPLDSSNQIRTPASDESNTDRRYVTVQNGTTPIQDGWYFTSYDTVFSTSGVELDPNSGTNVWPSWMKCRVKINFVYIENGYIINNVPTNQIYKIATTSPSPDGIRLDDTQVEHSIKDSVQM